jgi:chromosome segregation ATPase
MTDSAGQPQGSGEAGLERGAISAMRRIREELDLLQESLSAKDVRLGEREGQLNALAARLDVKARELATLNELINKERGKLQAKEAELRKQEGFVSRARDLEEALRKREASLTLRERAMRRTLEALKRQARELDDQRRELRRSALRSHPALAMQPLPPPGAWRLPVVMVLAVAAAAGVYAAIRPVYLVQAAWERPDGGTLTIDTVRNALSDPRVKSQIPAGRPEVAGLTSPPGAAWSADQHNHSIRVACRTRDPLDANRVLNACGQASLTALNRSPVPDPSADEAARLTESRRKLRRELAEVTIPPAAPTTGTAPSAGSVEALLTRVDELAASRQTVKTQLASVRAKLAAVSTRPIDSDAAIPEAVRSEAHTADPELSQARRRLKDQQETVRSLLASALTAAQPRLGEMRRALEELISDTTTQRQNPPDPEAGAELDAIQADAAKAKDRLEAFTKVWSEAAAGLKQAADPLAVQRTIETSVKEYVAASSADTASLERGVRAIGEAGSQITKRLVVRAALMKTLRRVTEAHRELAARLDDATAAASFRLEVAMQAAGGASETIAARLNVIDANLRERFASQAKQARQRDLEQLRQQEQTLAAKAAELTDSLVPAQGALQELTRRWAGSLERIEKRQEAYARRNRLQDELTRIDERLTALREAAARKPAIVRFVSASFSPEPVNRSARIAWSALAALLVLGIGSVVAIPALMARLRWAAITAASWLTFRKGGAPPPVVPSERNGRSPQPPTTNGRPPQAIATNGRSPQATAANSRTSPERE